MTLQWQLAHDSARSYEDVLVPTYLGPAAGQAVRQLTLTPGATVLDVGCGTGAAARAVKSIVGPPGRVVASDVNRYMLEVGRLACPDVEFWDADARALPFADGTFDATVCAQTMQY